MGVRKFAGRHTAWGAAMAGVLALFTTGAGGGCQQSSQVTHRRIIEHQAMIDFSGLGSSELIEKINARAAVPRNWDRLESQSTPLYTHQQWRSPSTRTGIGVAHIRLPIPISTGMLMWIAKREYTKKGNDGKILAEWTDELGRPWFDAENNKYRVRGYVIVNGFEAWVIYFGYKVKFAPDPAELSLAARAAETIVPNVGGSSKSSEPTPEPAEKESVARGSNEETPPRP
jgi:hypothetical protein